jgi:hypothetical protein
MLVKAPISTRNRLGPLLQELGLRGQAVEIGTHRGDFAHILLSGWCGILHCVDPWDVPPGYADQARQLADSNGDRAGDFAATGRHLAKFQHRARLHRCLSVEALDRFQPESLDLVYVDGDHRLVEQDVRAWWSKVRRGGMLACHDFLCVNEIDNGWGRYVQPALLGFAEELGRDVYMIVEEDNAPWSAYIIK